MGEYEDPHGVQAEAEAEEAEGAEMRIVYTAGVWDLFHEHHLSLLERSRALGDRLVVGVVTDEGTAAYKPEPPVNREHHRLRVIQGLRCVDAAFLQPGTDPSPVLRALAAVGVVPEVMTHGDDWSELREGNETLAELGIRLVLLPYGLGGGTTAIKARIRGSSNV